MKSYPYYICIFFLSLALTFACGHSHNEETADHDELHHHDDDADHHEDEEDHHDHDNMDIIIEPQQAQKFQLEYETVKPGEFQDVIKTGGVIESSTSDIYTITAKKSGVVTLAPGVNVGALINSGARVATISSEGLEGGDINRAALANLATAKAEYERLKPLYEDNLVTAATFREAERVYHEAQALAGIKSSGGSISESSPTSGTFTQVFVNSGQYVEMGAPIATVAKNSRLTLRADLPAKYSSRAASVESANFIPEGSAEIVSLRDLDGKKISGAASASMGGYIPVYFSFSGNSQSHPGGYAEVYLLGSTREGVISVPRTAIMELQGNKFVYVMHDGHAYEKRLVKTGTDNGERVEILEGLQEGEQIVAKGASVVRMAEVSAVAPPAHSHNH